MIKSRTFCQECSCRSQALTHFLIDMQQVGCWPGCDAGVSLCAEGPLGGGPLLGAARPHPVCVAPLCGVQRDFLLEKAGLRRSLVEQTNDLVSLMSACERACVFPTLIPCCEKK